MKMDTRESESGGGGLLSLVLRTTGSALWIGPAWAVLCGAVASGALERTGQMLVSVLLGVILADPILSSVWRLAGSLDYHSASGHSANPGKGFSVPSLPYTLPDSVAGRLRKLLGDKIAGWRWTLWPRAGGLLLTMGFSSGLALLIAAVLGPGPVALAALVLGIAAVRLALRDRADTLDAALGSLALAGAPWLLGYFIPANPLAGGQGVDSLIFGLVWAATYAGVFHGCALIGARCLSVGAQVLMASQVVSVSLLILSKSPVWGGAVALLLLPQVMLQPLMLRLDDGEWYLRRVQGFTMLAMLAMALGLPT
jgi:hypothetical protein